jgi:hypothetical protein
MKKLFTLIILLSMSLSYAQNTSIHIGVSGKDMYYKTDANVYLSALELTFENDVYDTAATDNVNSWIDIYKNLQLNAAASLWSVTVNVNNKKKLLLYTDAGGVLKPTDGEFVKFFSFSDENTLVSIDDAGVFVSDDTVLESTELITPSVVVDNTLNIDEISFIEVTPYPNPLYGGVLNIAGLTETFQATIYDLTGKVNLITKISPSKNAIDVSHLPNSLFMLSLHNGTNSRVFKIVKE